MSEQAATEEVAVEKPEPKKSKKNGGPEPAPPAEAKPPSRRTLPAREPVSPHVYHAINDVKLALASMGGITKDRRTDYGDRYKFRGIDDMYNTLCDLTAEAGLVMVPRVVNSRIDREERAKGGAFQTHVWLTVEVDFISSVDGSKHTGCFLGEAIDTSDKASNKAMSAAMKYACIMAFQIPTHGESDDTENHNHEVAPPAQRQPPEEPEYSAPPKGKGKLPPKLDTSAAAIDMQIALSEKIAVCEDFKSLYGMAMQADDSAEPGRGVVLEKIHARTQQLMAAAPTKEVLGESKGLIQALHSPPTLMATYNKRYAELRGQK